MNKQKLTLLIVLIVLALAVTWSILSIPRQKTIGTQKTAPDQAKQANKAPADSATASAENVTKSTVKPPSATDDRILRLDLLEREQPGFKGYHRNIFKPVFTDEIKLMKQRAAAIKPLPVPPVAVVAQPPAPVQPAVQPETHQTVLARFTFLGFLKKDNRKTIFLSKDKEIVLVRKGEIFAKNYEATAITDQALTIRVIDTGEEIVIPLTENRPLTAAIK